MLRCVVAPGPIGPGALAGLIRPWPTHYCVRCYVPKQHMQTMGSLRAKISTVGRHCHRQSSSEHHLHGYAEGEPQGLLFIVYCLFGSPLATAVAAAILPGVHTEIKYITYKKKQWTF